MKKTALFILCIVLIFCSAIVVSAHPGRTDSDGGHTDSSTGEYHYHHGYPAHDHYDMDGDGDLDCPYNFVDKSNKSTAKNSTAKDPSKETTSSKKPTVESEKPSSDEDDVQSLKTITTEIIPMYGICFGVICLILSGVFSLFWEKASSFLRAIGMFLLAGGFFFGMFAIFVMVAISIFQHIINWFSSL